jgi:hypothetical protein
MSIFQLAMLMESMLHKKGHQPTECNAALQGLRTSPSFQNLRGVLLRSVLPDVPSNIIITASVSRTSSLYILGPLTSESLVEVFRLGDLARSFLDIATLFGRDSPAGDRGAILYCPTVSTEEQCQQRQEVTYQLCCQGTPLLRPGRYQTRPLERG